jgi:hypothetical protein
LKAASIFYTVSMYQCMLTYFILVAMQLRTWRHACINKEAQQCMNVLFLPFFFTENYYQGAEILIPPTKLIFKHSHFTTLTKIWNFSNISLYWDDVNMTSNWLQCIKENEISIKIYQRSYSTILRVFAFKTINSSMSNAFYILVYLT